MGPVGLGPGVRIEVRDLSVTAVESRRRLLERVDLTIAPGERVAVIGHSGAGKTLLARAMVGVLPKGIVATGEIACLLPQPYEQLEDNSPEAMRSRLVMVPQAAASSLPPLKSAVSLVREVLSWERRRGQILLGSPMRPLNRVGFAPDSLAVRSLSYQLSGGMAQRVALAVALATSAAVMLLDEPTAGLDPIAAREIADLMRSLNEREGITIVLATHNIRLAASLCPRFIVLRSGRIVAEGDPKELILSDDPYIRK